MNELLKKLTRKLQNGNLAFVILVALAFFAWPKSWIHIPDPIPRAGIGKTVATFDFDQNVLANQSSGWGYLFESKPKHVSVQDGHLVVDINDPGRFGAVFIFRNYMPRHIYNLILTVKQFKTASFLTVNSRKKGTNRTPQIAGVKILPVNGNEYQRISVLFVAPEEADSEILVRLYKYNTKKDAGGKLMADNLEIIQW